MRAQLVQLEPLINKGTNVMECWNIKSLTETAA